MHHHQDDREQRRDRPACPARRWRRGDHPGALQDAEHAADDEDEEDDVRRLDQPRGMAVRKPCRPTGVAWPPAGRRTRAPLRTVLSAPARRCRARAACVRCPRPAVLAWKLAEGTTKVSRRRRRRRPSTGEDVGTTTFGLCSQGDIFYDLQIGNQHGPSEPGASPCDPQIIPHTTDHLFTPRDPDFTPPLTAPGRSNDGKGGRRESPENAADQPHQQREDHPRDQQAGVTRNAKARCEKVCQFMVPVVKPLTAARPEPRTPPARCDQHRLQRERHTTLPPPNRAPAWWRSRVTAPPPPSTWC